MSKNKQFFRTCPNPADNPKCFGTMGYTTEKEMRLAEKNGNRCPSCRALGHVMTSEGKRRISAAAKERLADPNNHPWFGKRHSEVSRRKMSESQTGRKHTEATLTKLRAKVMSAEAKRKISEAMKGRPCSEATRVKLRAAMADPAVRRKMSEASSGANNAMYGKPSPNSGKRHSVETRRKISLSQRGRKPQPYGSSSIGGWYGALHFRSTCELRFLLESKGDWESAEGTEFRIPYETRDGVHFYYPDWCNRYTKQLVEIKPRGWQRYRKDGIAKKYAATAHCKMIGWEYRVVVAEVIPKQEVFEMRQDGLISLDQKWERQYQEWARKRAGRAEGDGSCHP